MDYLKLNLMEKLSQFDLPALILLPFNIWFYAVTFPFRVLLNIFYGDSWKHKSQNVRYQPIHYQNSNEDRSHSWFPVERINEDELLKSKKSSMKEELINKPKEEDKKIFYRDEIEELKQKLAEYKQKELQSINNSSRLEAELARLQKTFDSKSQSKKKFEIEKKRINDLINQEKTKNFDLQQIIIGLKNQILKEHEQMESWKNRFEQLELKQQVQEKKHQKRVNQKNKKSTSTVEVKVEEEKESNINSVWHAAHHEKDYTEMIAKAQQQEEHKSFSEVLKESIQKDEKLVSNNNDEPSKFTIIGGSQSSQHVIENPIKIDEEEVEELKSIETKKVESKTVWNIPEHKRDYTQMIAKAQIEEIKHPKLSDSIKENLLKQENNYSSSDKTFEFAVIGGDLSNKHISAN